MNDNYSSSLPGISGYNWVLNNPNLFTDPDGNFTTSIYNSSTTIDVSGGSFNNGFTNVSFAAAAYSVGYYDFSGKASGEYRRRASDVETRRIFNYKGDPNNVKILYDDYWEWAPGDVTGVIGIKSIMFQSVVGNAGMSTVRPQAISASMISTTLDYYNIKNAFYAKIAYDTYDIGKVAPAVGKFGSYLGNVSVLLSGSEYVQHIASGGSIVSPESLLFAGDVLVNKSRLTRAPGFFLSVGWEAGKALGRYKNHLEKKWSPGGLDGLITTPK